MPIRNLHHNPFDEGTLDKLDLYRDYLREWLPVFINGPALDSINVFDFFAGPGFDVEGNPGSPVITCDEIQKAIAINQKKRVVIKAYFNEKSSDKYTNLSSYNGMLARHARKAFNLLINNKKLPKQKLHISYGAWKKTDAERIRLS